MLTKNYLTVVMLALVCVMQESSCEFVEDPSNTTCTLGEHFVIQCCLPIYAVTSRWVYNNSRVYINAPPEGLSPTSRHHKFKMNMTCVRARHYTTIQCVAITSVVGPHTTEEPSRIATIKVGGMPERIMNLRNLSYPSVVQLTWDEVESNAAYCVTVRRDGLFLIRSCQLLASFSLPRGNATQVDTDDTQYEFVVSATNNIGTGPSSALFTNFYSGLPDSVTNVSVHPLPSATLIMWDSLGHNITYCIKVTNCTGEVCRLLEPRYVLNATCPEARMPYRVAVTAVSAVGRGLPFVASHVLPRLPGTVRNVSVHPMACAAFITWSSLGPDIQYCINTVISTVEEVCGLVEPHYVLNVTCPEARTHYGVTVTAVSHVGRGYPTKVLQVAVLPLQVTASLELRANETETTPLLTRELIIVIVVSLSAISSLILLVCLLITIFLCCKLSQNRKVLRSIVSIDMLACDAYGSCKMPQPGDMKFAMDDKGCRPHYDDISNAAKPDPLYAHIT